MSHDARAAFLAADVVDRLKMALDPASRDAVAAYLGPRAFAEYEMVARSTDLSKHLALTPPNVMFLPGVMGSLLFSRNRGGVWWVDVLTRRRIDDLRLSPEYRLAWLHP